MTLFEHAGAAAELTIMPERERHFREERDVEGES